MPLHRMMAQATGGVAPCCKCALRALPVAWEWGAGLDGDSCRPPSMPCPSHMPNGVWPVYPLPRKGF